MANVQYSRNRPQAVKQPPSALHAPGLRWHARGDVTVIARNADGSYSEVMVPASCVRSAIRRAAAEEQLEIPSHVGDVDIVGWFGSSLWKKAKKTVKSVVRKVKKVAKKVVHHVKRVAKKALKPIKKVYRFAAKPLVNLAMKVSESKTFGALLYASMMVCPAAVGGSTFAAWMSAHSAAKTIRAGGAAAKLVKNNIKKLASKKMPSLNQKYLIAALQSAQA
jgi:hypothetical protein